MNNFIKDSGLFFKNVSKEIHQEIKDFEVINLTMNMALGMEKLLKGILYDVNPTYVLIEPAFKSSVQIIYKNKLIKEPDSSTELIKNPNGDVITFRNSVLRAQYISETTNDNKNILFNLSDARDIIAHCELKNLDLEKYKTLLLRDFYPLLKNYSDELKVKKGHFFSGNHIKLAKFSSKLQKDLEREIELIIDVHEGKWNTLKGNAGYITEKQDLTNEILKKPNKELIVCPACENEAILYLKPILEYNPYIGDEIQIGNEIMKLKCQFCKLEITDSKKFDSLFIKAKDVDISSLCSRCGDILDFDNATGLCVKCDEYYGTQN